MKAKDVMTMRVVSVSPQNSVKHAVQIMLDRRISGVPVLDDDGHLVGILSEGDLLRRMELGMEAMVTSDRSPASDEVRARSFVKSHGWSVSDIMTRDPVVVDEDMPLDRIARLLEEHRINRVPVMRDGTLIGIVSRADLLHAIAMATLDGTAPGDDAIRQSVLTRLHETAGIETAILSVTVSAGVVHLWGVVGSLNGRDAARVAAEGVRGVEGVVNHMTIAVRT